MTIGHPLWPEQLSSDERRWLDPGAPEHFDREPDVAVVGGGALGLATAVACHRAGFGSVVLLEREHLAAGASGGAAGQLMPEAHVGVDPPALVDLGRRSLLAWRELEHSLPGGVGLSDRDWLDSDGVVHRQARLNPQRAVARLAASLPCVATGAPVDGVSVSHNRIASLATRRGEVRPGVVVFATGNPPRLEGLDLHLPWSEVKGHMLASEPTQLAVPQPLWSMVSSIEQGRLLMGGTIDTDDDERVVRAEVIASLWAELETAWPAVRGVAISHTWACFRPAHPDRLPVIDRVPGLDNAWFTSGHYKTGILMAPATGQALAEWIASSRPPLHVAAFSAHRLAVA